MRERARRNWRSQTVHQSGSRSFRRKRTPTDMTSSRVRKIRKSLGFSQQDFAHILWVTWTTVSRWETGFAAPSGVHLRILNILEQHRTSRTLRPALRDPRSGDPMFVLYRLLEPLYSSRPVK